MNAAFGRFGRAGENVDLMSLLGKMAGERLADQPGSAIDGDAHLDSPSIGLFYDFAFGVRSSCL